MKEDITKAIEHIKDNIRDLSKMAGQPALLCIENVEYLEGLLATQKKEILEKIIKEFEYGGEQYYGGSTTRLPIILEIRKWLKNQLT